MVDSMDRGQSGPGRSRAKQVRIAVGFLIIVAAVVVLIARANKSSMVYYVTVSELLDQGGTDARKGLRVTGTVVPGTIERKSLELRFEMTDGQKAIPVNYRGVVPDTFSEDGEVVVEGSYAHGGAFEASFLMAKCPSKYEASPEGAEHPEEIPMTSSGGI